MKSNLKAALLILLLGIMYGGYEYYEFQNTEVPQMESERQALEAQVTQLQGELRKLQEFARNIEQIKVELKELNLQLESALEYMPRQFNLSALLRKLTMLAQNSGLELFTFRPAQNEERQGQNFYSTLGINFELKGNFTQILLFLDQISRLKRIVNTETLRMSVRGDPSRRGVASATTLSVQALVKTYRFSE